VSTPEEHETDPDWAFSHDQNITCPECSVRLSGLNWIMNEGKTTTVAMALVPCGHQLSNSEWELKYSGRDRVLSTVIRKPTFVRKNGS
jgi:hypothetical protein